MRFNGKSGVDGGKRVLLEGRRYGRKRRWHVWDNGNDRGWGIR